MVRTFAVAGSDQGLRSTKDAKEAERRELCATSRVEAIQHRGWDVEAVTILLADDEAILLLDFEAALTDAGFLVTSVASGAKAIDILHSSNSPVGGLVTDIRFREFPDGWEVARVARAIDPDMPIVYISGHGAVDWTSRGVPNSIMIEKPFTLSQLVTAVSQLLNARPPRAS